MSKKQSTGKRITKRVAAVVAPRAKQRKGNGPEKAAADQAIAPEKARKGPERAAKAPPAERDRRLPEPGTVLQKVDRHGAVRCECKVEEDGVRYAGTLYRSISSAALAAAKDLGLKNKTQNGYVFWGVVKPARPSSDMAATVERAWERYLERTRTALKDGDEEVRTKVAKAVLKHALVLQRLETSATVQAK